MKRWLLLLLFPSLALCQTRFSIFDQVGAKGAGRTPAKGQMFYTSDTSGTIEALPIGTANHCLVVDGSGIPAWSSVCASIVSSVGFSAPAQFTVTGSPITTFGTITLGWQSVSQNYGLFGPTGGSGAPTFRQMVAGDLGLTAKGDLPTVSTVLARLPVGADGYVLTADSGETVGMKWALAGAGTVTSVGLSMPTQFGVTNSPVTGADTLTVAWNTQTANHLLIGPTNGVAAAPTFRGLDYRDVGFTQKGDLLTKDSTNIARLGVGSDGYVLSADSAEATGLKWIPAGGVGTVTSVGLSANSCCFDISGSPVVASGTLGFTLKTGSATEGQVLRVNNTNNWEINLLQPNDIPLNSISQRGAVATAPNDTAKFWRGDATWATPPGSGTVTSVTLGAPTGFTVTGTNPITSSGTFTLAFGTTTAYKLLLTNNLGDVGWGDLTTAGIPTHYIGTCQPSGTGHAAGLAPDTPSSAGTTKFLREDCSWALPPQGTVTSVGMTVPGEISLSGSPVTGSGSLGLGWNVQNANKFFAGPASGADDVPAFRLIVAADLPVFVASGASHAKGAVPDPGATAGTSKFLREDSSWQVPTFNSSIEVKEVDGSPDATGVSILRFDQSSGLAVTDNGGGTATVACTTCSGASATAYKTDTYTGDNSTTVFTLTSTPVTNGVGYVALNGVAQKTSAWSLGGSNVTMTTAPFTGDLLVIGYYTSRPSTSTHLQEDFTGAGSTDFTLAHSPIADGILLVTLRGLVQQQTAWTIVAGTTLRMSSAVPTGDAVSISYNY